MKAIHLRTEHMVNPMGIGISKPWLSWNCEDGIKQTAFEIEAFSGKQIIWQHQEESNRMHSVLAKEMNSRDRIEWRVRLRDEGGKAGPWSEKASFEVGLLNEMDWSADWIQPEAEKSGEGHHPASYLRKSFTLKDPPAAARLYATAYGLYEVYLNGVKVGRQVLTPGNTSYDRMLAHQTYDVTAYLQSGENHILVILGDGWYRSCAGIDGVRNLFGSDLALLFQLEGDGHVLCVSDGSWEATQKGPLRENDMQQGEIYDARYELLSQWHPVVVKDLGYQNILCSNSVPLREHERFAGKLLQTPNGETVIDFGQNLAGYIEFELQAHEGDIIFIEHGETLDENGNFTMENFQSRSRHIEGGIKQRVEYICKEGENHYKSKFTIWGFRYGHIITNVDLSSACFTAIAVYSDMEEAGVFECSDQRVNQLVQNTSWSMKSNFVDVPTDCPTRERAAWTGDLGIFVQTGAYLKNCFPVIRKWLSECRTNQYPDGRIAIIAPRTNEVTRMQQMLSGSVGWGDACIIAPYVLYQHTGDVRILEENYAMMKNWYHYLETRAQTPGSLLPPDHPLSAYVIDAGIDFGEWLEPDTHQNLRDVMGKPQYKVATAYFAYSGSLLASIAEILGIRGDAEHYRMVSKLARKAYLLTATDDGTIVSNRQAEYVRALSFGLLPKEKEAAAAEALNQLIIENNFHLNTGFLSTPMLCGCLTRFGYTETAYRLLLQDTMPSWLYEIKQGATTIWEKWDGINEKGQPQDSLNHYAYGAICGWLFNDVCGIQLQNQTVNIAPHPHPLLQWARAIYHSPVGTIKSGWKYDANQILFEFDIPANVLATVYLPDMNPVVLSAGHHQLLLENQM